MPSLLDIMAALQKPDASGRFMPMFGDPRTRRMGGILGALPDYQLTPGATPPGPGAPVSMPVRQPVAPGPIPNGGPPGLLDRIMGGLGSARDRMMPAPAGIGDLLSPGEISSARGRGVMDIGLSLLANAHGQGGGNAPSLGSSLLQGAQAGRQGYEGDVDKTVQQHVQGMQFGQQQHILQGRQAIGQFLAQSVNGSPEQQLDAMKKAYMMSTAIGDTETAKALQGVIEKSMENHSKPLQVVPAGGHSLLLDPETHMRVGDVPHSPTPMSEEARAMRETGLDMRQQALADREEQQRSQREARHVAQYEANVKPFAQTAAAYQTLDELRSAAMHGDPIAQQTALQDFIRMVLPGQMVAQGELHNYAHLMGLGDRAGQMLMKLERGSPLSTAQIKSIYDRADGIIKAKRGASDYLRKQAQKRASAYQIDPEAFVDHFGFLNTQPQAPATGAAAVDRHLNKSY
jgi:hypothetical protein